MTAPEVDQELERLLAVARAATAPDADARERVRVRIAPRLGSGATATQAAGRQRAWVKFGAAVLGVCAVGLWLARAPQTNHVTSPVAAAAPVSVSAAPAPVPEATPSAPSALDDTPPASAKPAQPAPSIETSSPAPSSTHNAGPAEELPLVRAMQQALRSGNSRQALALAADHARRFPRGTLVEEREGVRAVAQCQLVAPDARRATMDAFTRRFAGSPYAARVKAACQ